MIGKFKNKHVGQIDTVLIEGVEYERMDFIKMIKISNYVVKPKKKGKK